MKGLSQMPTPRQSQQSDQFAESLQELIARAVRRPGVAEVLWLYEQYRAVMSEFERVRSRQATSTSVEPGPQAASSVSTSTLWPHLMGRTS